MEVLIQIFYSSESERVQALKCTQSMKVKSKRTSRLTSMIKRLLNHCNLKGNGQYPETNEH